MDWIIGLQKAIDYIENNLTDTIDYEKVAAQSYSSSYHFQRVFSILCGFTIGEYIRNRRLSLAGLFMEEMINALMTAQKTPEIFAALHKDDTKLTAHEDFNDSVCENHDKINFLKRWTHSDTQFGAVLSLEAVMASNMDAVENASDFFSSTESTEKAYMELRNGFLATLSGDDRIIFIMRENGKMQKEIAEALGYKTHSAVTKRLQAMREQLEMYNKRTRIRYRQIKNFALIIEGVCK